jgi:hypothetical protein
MRMSKYIAGWWLALLTSWLLWVLVAPVVADTAAREQARHDCPKLKVTHGVGADLRTFKKAVDLCAHR